MKWLTASRAALLVLCGWLVYCAWGACFRHDPWAEFNLCCLAIGWYVGSHW